MTTPERVDLIDLSNWQKGTYDFAAAKRAGLRGVYHKATEGTNFKDGNHDMRRAQVKRARGLRFGSYHFARPTRSSGVAQARYFLAYAKPVKGDMRPMLDFEDPVVEGWSSAKRTAWVKSFVGEVKRQTGVGPFIYIRSGFDLDDNFDCPLWVPAYSNAMTQPRIPRPWKQYTIWQFSDGKYGKPNSLPGVGHVDLNTMNGDPATLVEVFRLGYKAPARPPVDTKPALKPTKPTRPKPKPPAPKPPAPRQRHLACIDWNVERDRNSQAVLDEIRHLAAQADVLTLQETQGYGHVLSLVDTHDVYAFRQATEQNETAILVRKGLSVEFPQAVPVTSRGWFTVRGGHTPPKWATVAVVEGVRFASVHTPPTVQTRLQRLRSPRRWGAYKELVRNIDKAVGKRGHSVVCGDWNLNATNKGIGAWLRDQMASDPLNLRRYAPAGRTHDTRVIDYVFARGVKVTDVRTLPPLGSDHNPISYTVSV